MQGICAVPKLCTSILKVIRFYTPVDEVLLLMSFCVTWNVIIR